MFTPASAWESHRTGVEKAHPSAKQRADLLSHPLTSHIRDHFLASRPPNTTGNSIAARDAAQQEGFLREIDEALREEQALDLFKRFGKPLAAAIVLGLLGLAGYLYWDHASSEKAADHAAKTITALDQLDGGNRDAASKVFTDLAADGPDGSRAVAAMALAGIKADEGKADEAAKAFTAVADDSSAPQPLRDLATIRAVAVKFDSLPPDQVIARLKPLAIPGNAWFGPAGELVALAYLKQGKVEQAGPLLAAIARDKNVSESQQARTRQMAAQLGFDAVDDVNKLVGAQQAPAPAR